MRVHARVRGAGNHHFNIALIKLPIYRSESTQEPFLGRLPPAAGRCQALWNPISSPFSDHYPLLSLSSPLSSSIGSSHCMLKKKKGKEKEKKEADGWSSINTASWRWINTHQVQQAPVGKSARCSTLQKIDNLKRRRFKPRLFFLFSPERKKRKICTVQKDNYTSCNAV